jgi:hypothetical protein
MYLRVRGARLLQSIIFLLAVWVVQRVWYFLPLYYRYTKKKYKIIDVVWLCSMNPSTIECLAPTTFTMRISPPPPHVINQSSRYKLKLLRHFCEMGYQYLPLIYENASWNKTILTPPLFQARKVRYHVFVCWEEVVYSDLNFLTPTLSTLSIEVLVTSQKFHVFVCLGKKGGGLSDFKFATPPLFTLIYLIFLRYNVLHKSYIYAN